MSNSIDFTRDLFVRSAPGITDPALVKALSDHADAVQTAIDAVRRQVVDVRSDPALSPRGVQLKLPAVAASGAQRLIGTTASVKQLATGIERSSAIFSTARRHRLPPNVDIEESRASEREARDRLYSMDPLEVESLYFAACERGDTASVRAFELAPGMFKLVSAEAQARGAELYAKAAFPDEWNVLQEQKACLSLMDGNLNTATTALVKLCGSSGANDPIAEMAGTGAASESDQW
jgi:hypothetical protein